AQGDNAVIDLAGWVRWFQLSAIVPAGGDYTIEVDDARETAQGIDAPRPQAVIVADGASGDSEHARRLGTWRRGPVVTEAVWEIPLGQRGLRARVLESRWADGQGSSAVVMHYGLSRPNEAIPSSLTYDCTITRGAERLAYSAIRHAAFAQ